MTDPKNKGKTLSPYAKCPACKKPVELPKRRGFARCYDASHGIKGRLLFAERPGR